MENEKLIAESALVKLEATNRRLFIITLVLIFSLLASNLGWIYYESQWEVVEATDSYSFSAQQEGENNNVENINLGDSYGETDSQSN